MKLSDIWNNWRTLNELSDVRFKDVRTSYKISKLIKAVSEELKDIDEQRRKLIEQHAEKDGNGEFKKDENGGYVIPDTEKVTEEFQKLLDKKAKLNIEKLSIDELEGSELTPNQLIALEPFMSDD